MTASAGFESQTQWVLQGTAVAIGARGGDLDDFLSHNCSFLLRTELTALSVQLPSCLHCFLGNCKFWGDSTFFKRFGGDLKVTWFWW